MSEIRPTAAAVGRRPPRVFFGRPVVRPCCGARAARGRRIGRAPRGRGEEPTEGCFSGAPSVARAQSIGRALRRGAGRCRGCVVATVRRLRGSRCGASGGFISRCGARCARLAPTACAVAFTVWRLRGVGGATSGDFIGRGVSRCAGLASAACAAALTVPRGRAHRWAFRFPKSARAAIAAPRPRRHRPAHGLGRGAPHRPRGCSTAQPGC